MIEDGGARRIPLTRGMFALVDAEDYERVSAVKWHAVESFGRFCAAARVRGTTRRIKMHRFIIDAPEGVVVDHINRNPLDNRRENLRLATANQNARNISRVAPSSGLRGVHKVLQKGGVKWRAMIRDGDRIRCLGYYVDKFEAAKAYDAASEAMVGEFAVTNEKLGLL